jgi:tetratricopeptide (TPR) repeat protein
MRRTRRVVAVVGLAVALFGVGAVALPGLVRQGRPAPPASGVVAALQARPVIQASSLADVVSSLQQRLRSDPGDWRSHATLGLAYVQQARITADPSYYPKAQAVLERSLALHAVGNFEALLGLASLAAARHQFGAALDWAGRARAANPHSADAHALLGDALVELGRYEEAFDTYQAMVDLRPDLSTYARVSYAWELQGSYENAVRAMELALQAAGSPVDAAWASVQLGDLQFNAGRLQRAADQYRRAAAADPSFVPARAGLARVAAARGRLGKAIDDLEWVVERQPSPEHVIALGDLYAVSGKADRAEQQYELVRVQERLLETSGVDVDLEIALFDADHGVHLPEALAAARSVWARRRSVHAADALAWTLYANGRFEEAIGYSNQALRLGTENALFYFHRGMIEVALGRDGAARRDLSRALGINPHFSLLWSGEAGTLLESMGGRP